MALRGGGCLKVIPGNMACILSVGQSNESGRGELPTTIPSVPEVMSFGNDYIFGVAKEPLDDSAGQIDAVSAESASQAGHGSQVKMLFDIWQATGRRGIVIPSSKGGTGVDSWAKPSNVFDRTTLWGSANYRAKVAHDRGYPVTAITWYQGEGDSVTDPNRQPFMDKTAAIWAGFRGQPHIGNVPIIYSQLGLYSGDASVNDRYQRTREAQRLMEAGSGSANSVSDAHMVVAHDLPLVDAQVHLNREGQIELGRRRALAYRQYVLKENINGTGPRLVSITKPTGTTIKVKTTRAINDDPNYEGYFTVYDNGVASTISTLGRDPGDDTAVLITLSGATSGTVTVEYKPVYNRMSTARFYNVVKDTDGLPLPAFGPLGLFN